MSAVINCRTLKVAKVARTLPQAEAWAEKLVPKMDDYVIVGHEKKHFSCFTEDELNAIYTDITRRPNTGATYSAKIDRVMDALSKVEEDDTPVGSIPSGKRLTRPDPSTTINSPEGNNPSATTNQQDEEKTMAKKKAASKKTASKKTASKKTASKKTASKKTAGKKATAKAATAPGERVVQNGVPYPRAGSVTETIWQIADTISAKHGEPAPRGEVLEQCEKKGIKPASASAGYQHWRKFHGLVKSK